MNHSCPKICFTYPSWPSPLLSALISRYCTRFVPGGCGWLVLSEKFKGGSGYSLTRGIGEFEPLPALCCLDSWIVVDRGVSSGSSAMILPVGRRVWWFHWWGHRGWWVSHFPHSEERKLDLRSDQISNRTSNYTPGHQIRTNTIESEAHFFRGKGTSPLLLKAHQVAPDAASTRITRHTWQSTTTTFWYPNQRYTIRTFSYMTEQAPP
jgi:hypothetical protein